MSGRALFARSGRCKALAAPNLKAQVAKPPVAPRRSLVASFSAGCQSSGNLGRSDFAQVAQAIEGRCQKGARLAHGTNLPEICWECEKRSGRNPVMSVPVTVFEPHSGQRSQRSDVQREPEKLRPTGFEPVILGSEDRCADSTTTKNAKDLRESIQAEVPTVVPSPSGANLFVDLSPDLTRVVVAWPTLPDTIKAAILVLVKTTAGPDA